MMGVNQAAREHRPELCGVLALVPAPGPNIISSAKSATVTAGIGVNAALTGHLVLSTLHTNDAPSSVNRLVNMGIEPFLVANAVNLVVAQRLVRRVCEQCKAPVQVPMAKLIEAGWDGPTNAAHITGAQGA
jgi:type II secretory ATPase GspE/PulE/Tfp pilus assembly ATPase PilB-like protein